MLVGILVLLFVILYMLGDPSALLLPLTATEEQREAFKEAQGFNDPIYEQFGRFAKDVFTLDFGRSTWLGTNSRDVFLARLPRSLILAFLAFPLAFLVAFFIGILSAVRPGTFLDRLIVGSSITAASVADFWLGLMLILVFAVWLDLLPVFGYGDPKHLVLPVLTLAALPMGRLTQITRTAMIEVLASQYITVAKSKGLKNSYILMVHAGKNAMIAITAGGAMELSRLLGGGVIVVEFVFAWPGIGLLWVNSIVQRDLSLVSAVVFFTTLMILALNIVVDIFYTYLDPRIRLA